MNKQIVVAALAALAAHGALAADVAAGQYPDYLLKALNDYHKGARKNPIMGAIAKPLTKADMQNLAAYYGSLPGPLTHRK